MKHHINRMKVSYDHLNRCRKAFDKTQYPFMIKTLNKLGIEETNISQQRSYMTSSQLTSYLMVKG